MNWTGGNLAQFKRKNLSKKVKEHQRIEEYIRRRQLAKQVPAFGQDASAGSTSANSFISVFQSRSVANESLTMQTNPTEYFKRPIDTAISSNPWAGLDPKFMKPKAFPSFLKNTHALYFDAALTNFPVKNPEESSAHCKNSGNVTLNQSIRFSQSLESRNAPNDFEFSENQSDEDEEMLPLIEKDTNYGLSINFNEFFMQTSTRLRPTSRFSSTNSQSFASPCSMTESNFISPRANSELIQNLLMNNSAITRTPNIVPPSNNDLNVSHSGVLQNHNKWNFEVEEKVENLAVFNPSRSFQKKEHFANFDNSHLSFHG